MKTSSRYNPSEIGKVSFSTVSLQEAGIKRGRGDAADSSTIKSDRFSALSDHQDKGSSKRELSGTGNKNGTWRGALRSEYFPRVLAFVWGVNYRTHLFAKLKTVECVRCVGLAGGLAALPRTAGAAATSDV